MGLIPNRLVCGFLLWNFILLDSSPAPHDTALFSPFPRPTSFPKHTRSQTAPGSISLRPKESPPLRRHQTAGPSTRIEALQRAYTAVVNDESQVPVEDLVQATALVNQIGKMLNEQMGKRLTES